MVDAGDVLLCPRCRSSLSDDGDHLLCASSHRFPVVQGVAVLLRDDVQHTIGIAERSLTLAEEWTKGKRDDPMFVDTLGISDQEREGVRNSAESADDGIDPVISYLIGATNGILYKSVIGNLERVPIPELRLPAGKGGRLVDLGCNWGRWSLAAAAKGWRPIGVDPSLGAVLAAKRLAAKRGLSFEGVVGDARHLPLANSAIDAAFSYSVLQHFSKPDARLALREIARVVRPDGEIRVQMASCTGVRSAQHMFRRRFREPTDFEVRYWWPAMLLRECRTIFGDGVLEVDCYFGLGLQQTDKDLYSPLGRKVLTASEVLRRASNAVPPLKLLADSLYLVARNKQELESTGSV